MIRTEWQADAEYFALPPHTGPLPTAEEIKISNALNEYVAAVAARNACLKIMGTLNRARKAGKTWAEVTNRDIYRAISGRAPITAKTFALITSLPATIFGAQSWATLSAGSLPQIVSSRIWESDQ
jgi:hypothetical protein